MEQARTIVEAAQRLIAAKGPNFTTQELIKEAGIALQTFYRYFPSKDHLLLAVIEDIIDENCKRVQEEREQADRSDRSPPSLCHGDPERPRGRRQEAPASSRRSIGASRRSTRTRCLRRPDPSRTCFSRRYERRRPSVSWTRLILNTRRGSSRSSSWPSSTITTAPASTSQVRRSPRRVWSFCLAALGGEGSEKMPVRVSRRPRRQRQ